MSALCPHMHSAYRLLFLWSGRLGKHLATQESNGYVYYRVFADAFTLLPNGACLKLYNSNISTSLNC